MTVLILAGDVVGQSDDEEVRPGTARRLTGVTWRLSVAPCTTTRQRKSQIPFRYPRRTQVRRWSQTCSDLEFCLSRELHELAGLPSATSFGPVCDQPRT